MTEPIENKEDIEKKERYKELSHAIDEFIAHCDSRATFDTEKIWRQFNVITRTGKQNVWKALDERVRNGILEFKFGKYRRIDKSHTLINFRQADSKNYLPIKFPKGLIDGTTFGLENLVRIFPRSIIVIAGTKGGSKTAFCLNIARENMNSPELAAALCGDEHAFTKEPIVAYYTNELSPEELKDRLESFEDELDMWNILAEEKFDNFADAIYPNKINLIDALEVNVEAYRVADLIDAIYQKLDRGVAIIAMHKNPNAEYAAGGLYSAKKARLYLVIQDHTLLVKHSKKTVDGQTAEGTKWRFKLVNGAKYTQIGEVLIDSNGKEWT